MKRIIQTFFFLLIGLHYGRSQDSAVILNTKMFDNSHRIFLASRDGWVFKEGNDPSWSNKDIDTIGWIKLKPTGLAAKYADQRGKVEGWFRFKFKLDNDFTGIPLGFLRGGWAATDLYVDERLVASFGNTGTFGKNFEEYNPIDKNSLTTNLEIGREYLIAIHFVDIFTTLPPRQLRSARNIRVRSETMGLESFLMLTGPQYDAEMQKFSAETLFYRSIWLSVTALLSLLFWLLFILNAGENKTLLLIAINSTLAALSNLVRFYLTDTDISFNAWDINRLIQDISFWAFFVITFILTTRILNFNLSRNFMRFLMLYTSFGVINILFDFFGLFMGLNVIIGLLFMLFVLVSRWKRLKGAQWAIAGGLILSIFFGALLWVAGLQSIRTPQFFLLTCFYFSLPLSLAVYVSLRFNEIIKEVRENAKQVVRLSEEKREQALNQQTILEHQVKERTAELSQSLENLKATQSQLIQSEKMASLGELTAGIAHEIQNPLNFVNNFSEVNNELIEEVKNQKSKLKGEELDDLLNDIFQNNEKINHHGKRADAIVKGMLQHSTTSSGQKEPTDIDALADEYLRLAYHGFRAKDKSFTVTTKTDFDNSIGKINIIPQDIGRVILNLINNAFYAIDEKNKQNLNGYEPTVSVRTKKNNGKVEISVKDNGNGIPQKVLDKIFQPFFTTKPTGQGTGLGLSLSYDIVKAHGGELKVETKEGEGSEFIVQLP